MRPVLTMRIRPGSAARWEGVLLRAGMEREVWTFGPLVPGAQSVTALAVPLLSGLALMADEGRHARTATGRFIRTLLTGTIHEDARWRHVDEYFDTHPFVFTPEYLSTAGKFIAHKFNIRVVIPDQLRPYNAAEIRIDEES